MARGKESEASEEVEEVHVHWVIPKDLKAQLEQEAQERGFRTLSEYVTYILQRRQLLFQESLPIDKLLKPKLLIKPAPVDVRCFKCGQLIPKKTECGWIVGTSINICYKCLMEMASSAVKNMDQEFLKKALDAYKRYVQYSTLAREAKKELDAYTKTGIIFDNVKKVLEKLDELESKAVIVFNNIEREALKNLSSIDTKAVNKLLNELDRVKREIQELKSLLFGAIKLSKTVLRSVRKREAESYESMR